METDRDAAAEALAAVDESRARAAKAAEYPLWFWVFSGLALACLPASSALRGSTRDLLVGVAAAAVFVLAAALHHTRRVREPCASLGARGWLRELARMGPSVLVLAVGAWLNSTLALPWWAPLVTGGAFFVVWVGTGAVSNLRTAAR